MYITNLPTIFSSLTLLLPFYAAVDTNNPATAFCWGALTTTSVFLHITKKPFHLYGHGNCIPVLLYIDMFTVYVTLIRALIDGYFAGLMGITISLGVIAWGGIVFHFGRITDRFAFDRRADISILSHVSLHLLASFGGTGVIYLRALKNGLETSTL